MNFPFVPNVPYCWSYLDLSNTCRIQWNIQLARGRLTMGEFCKRACNRIQKKKKDMQIIHLRRLCISESWDCSNLAWLVRSCSNNLRNMEHVTANEHSSNRNFKWLLIRYKELIYIPQLFENWNEESKRKT